MSDIPKDAKSIFLAALDIQDAAERAAMLERSCGEDVALRQRVEDLLRAYGEPDGPLEKLAAALAPTELNEPIREQVGATIGPYKLMEQIGEGGFGLVFVAEQQRPIRRKVALKIIKPGMDSRDVIARFEAERQALALMDHPNIARVLDAGTTESGRPYFVMELVRGIPITDYCDQAQLTPRERLELFVPVCNAIQHAHQKGIIHRDVKPSNVLVTLHDDQPVVKVIDFGIAKALHQPLTERTVYTRFAQMIGTPLYMSPEQAQMSSLDIDTRSDIYSLGVLLYELLTGATPFDKQRFAKAAYDELLRIIREEEPPKPSMRLSKSTESLPSIAAQRKTEPAKLSRMFDGDLDWITMKALEKNRARRYETANSFAADVLRYLNDEPVEASPPSTAYRLRKFARKHRKPVIALTAIAAVLVIGIAGTTWGLFRAKQAEQAAKTAERAAMESERKTVDALGQARQERDAKEAEKDRAERQLANGLLRPIGFSDQATDPAELRSFVDWSAVKEPQLKLRVLEIALETPETASRVARRAERVIQSCVGLSPTRRANAIELVSAKQRDMALDPRIRIAACRLALELGSADLPAWVECCNYLSEPKNKGSDRFGVFVNFVGSVSVPPNAMFRLDLDPPIAILETSTDAEAIAVANGALTKLAPRLDPAQAKRAGDALIALLEKSTDANVLGTATSGLTALARRLEPAQAKRAGDAQIAILETSTDDAECSNAGKALGALAPQLETAQVKRAADALIAMWEKGMPSKQSRSLGGIGTRIGSPEDEVLVALAPRLEPAQAKRAGDALIALLEKSTDANVLDTATSGLMALARRLEPAQAKRAGDALIALLEKSTDANVLDTATSGLTALARRLEPTHVTRSWGALMAILGKSTDNHALHAAGIGLVALAPRLEPAQVTHSWGALTAILEKSTHNGAPHAAGIGLVALVPRLEAAQVTHSWGALMAILGKSTDFGVREAAAKVLVALAPRVEPAQVTRGGDALIAILEKPTDEIPLYQAIVVLGALAPRLEAAQVTHSWGALMAILGKSMGLGVLQAAAKVLVALAPRVEPAQVTRGGDALIAMLEKPLEKPSDEIPLYQAIVVLGALAPRLEAAQVTQSWDALMAMLEKSTDEDTRDVAGIGLAALAPRLEPAQVTRGGDALIAILGKTKEYDVFNVAGKILDKLGPRMEPTLRDDLSTTATTALLDYCSSFGNPDLQTDQMDTLTSSLSSPRSLAKLLSHPSCLAARRQGLLQRFEELVVHDGQPVFLKPETPDGKKAADVQLPPRRFHNLHAAAAWIQKNWPDFDLETNCPVTWRGSR